MILYLVPNKVIQGVIFSGVGQNICSFFMLFCFKKNKQVVCIQGIGMHFMHRIGNIMEKNRMESLLRCSCILTNFLSKGF